MNVSRTILALSLALIGQQAGAADPYFRFPAVRGDTIVFTAEGDLWRTSIAGGKATRLTTHPSSETHAAISQDGKLVAFVASYEGAQEAYVMPIEGGLPKRITFENGGVTVLGWTAQGEVLVSIENPVGPSQAPRGRHARPGQADAPRAAAGRRQRRRAGRCRPHRVLHAHGPVDDQRQREVLPRRRLCPAVALRPRMRRPRPSRCSRATRRPTTAAPCGGRAACTSSAMRTAPTISGPRSRTAATAASSPITRSGTCAPPRSATAASPTSWAPTCTCSTSPAARTALLHASLVSDFDQQRLRRVKSPLDALTSIEVASKPSASC